MPSIPPESKQTLLDLADADQQLRAVQHRKATLPEQERLDELVARHRELGERHARLTAELDDVTAKLREAEAEVERLETRIGSDTAKLNSGEGLTSRDLLSLQDEVDGFKDRLGDAEEIELELLEEREALLAQIKDLTSEADDVAAEGKEAAGARAAALQAVDGELQELTALRQRLAEHLPAAVLRPYDLVVDAGGVGAAEQSGAACPGCGQVFSQTDLRTLAGLPEDQLFECEDCGCLIVPA